GRRIREGTIDRRCRLFMLIPQRMADRDGEHVVDGRRPPSTRCSGIVACLPSLVRGDRRFGSDREAMVVDTSKGFVKSDASPVGLMRAKLQRTERVPRVGAALTTVEMIGAFE